MTRAGSLVPSLRTVAPFIAALRARPAITRSLLVLSTAAVSRGTIVITTIVLSHLLAAERFGQLLYFLASSQAGSIIIAQGASTVALNVMGRMLPGRKRAAARSVAVIYGFAAASSMLFGVGIVVLGPTFLPQLRGLLGTGSYALLAVSVAAQGMTALTLAVLAGLNAFRVQSMLSVGSTLIQYMLLVGGVALGRVGEALVLSVAVMVLSLVAIVVSAWRLAERQQLTIDRRALDFSRRRALGRGMLGFVAITTLGAILFEPVNWLCVSLLFTRPQGVAQAAIFLAANQWFAIILFVPINLTQVTLPLVSRAFHETGQIFGAAARRMLAISLAASAAAGVLLLAGMPLLLPLYSDDIRSGWPAFALIAVNGIIVAIQVATGQMLVAAGRVRANLAFNAGWSVIYLALTVGLVHSAAGLAGSRLAAYSLHAAGVLGFIILSDRKRHAG